MASCKLEKHRTYENVFTGSTYVNWMATIEEGDKTYDNHKLKSTPIDNPTYYNWKIKNKPVESSQIETIPTKNNTIRNPEYYEYWNINTNETDETNEMDETYEMDEINENKKQISGLIKVKVKKFEKCIVM